MTAFIDASDVAAYLGRALNAAELAQVDIVIDAACEYVENYCGRAFGTTTVTNEPQKIVNGTIYLSRPIKSVSSVKTRSPIVGYATTALTTSEWTIWNLATGEILVSSYTNCDALVSYAPVTTVPSEVMLAATILASNALAFTGDTSRASADIKRYSVGSELTVEYFDTVTSGGVPAQVAALLGPYRRMVVA